jgi:hypothetical protein
MPSRVFAISRNSMVAYYAILRVMPSCEKAFREICYLAKLIPRGCRDLDDDAIWHRLTSIICHLANTAMTRIPPSREFGHLAISPSSEVRHLANSAISRSAISRNPPSCEFHEAYSAISRNAISRIPRSCDFRPRVNSAISRICDQVNYAISRIPPSRKFRLLANFAVLRIPPSPKFLFRDKHHLAN